MFTEIFIKQLYHVCLIWNSYFELPLSAIVWEWQFPFPVATYDAIPIHLEIKCLEKSMPCGFNHMASFTVVYIYTMLL